MENTALRCPKGGDSGSGTDFSRRQWASHSQPKAGHFHALSLGMETKSWHSTDWLAAILPPFSQTQTETHNAESNLMNLPAHGLISQDEETVLDMGSEWLKVLDLLR